MSPLSAVQMGGYATSITHSKSEQVWISTLPIRWFVSKCSLKVFDFCSYFSLSYRKAHHKGCVWKSTQISSVSGLLLSQRSRLCWSIAVWANNATRWSILFVWGSLVLGKEASKDEWCRTTCIQGVTILGSTSINGTKSPVDHLNLYATNKSWVYSSSHFLCHSKTGMNRVDLGAARKIIMFSLTKTSCSYLWFRKVQLKLNYFVCYIIRLLRESHVLCSSLWRNSETIHLYLGKWNIMKHNNKNNNKWLTINRLKKPPKHWH